MSYMTTLVNTAKNNPMCECFVVSGPVWAALEHDAHDFLVERSGDVSYVQGLYQMTICGVPVSRTRVDYLNARPFIEVHSRDPYDLQAIVTRLLG